MNDITLMTIEEVAGMLRRGKVSPVELVEESLKKIAAWQETVNAFITILPDEARAAARRAEAELKKDGAPPLCGIPVALKDVYFTKGILSSMGSGMMADFKPDIDSTAGARLAGAGAVMMGKTNTHEWAFGSTGDVSFYGPCRNPWDPGRVTGGSSSGSAAATCTGMVYAAMGSDSGGSIRTPAGLCGVVGFKPTYGLVSLYGIFPLTLNMDHAGPLTRSVMDAALIVDAITGYDPLDPCPVRYRGEPTRFAEALRGVDDLRGTTLGIPDSYFFDRVDYGVEKCFQESVRALEKLGAKVVSVSIPDLHATLDASSITLTAEAAWIHKDRMASNPGGFTPEILTRLEGGAAVPVVDYIAALQRKYRFTDTWEQALADVDAVITPTVPATAAPIGARVLTTRGREEPVHPTNSWNVRIADVTGGPALSVPCGLTADGMPAGLQIMGKLHDDVTPLKIGYAYEKQNPFTFPAVPGK